MTMERKRGLPPVGRRRLVVAGTAFIALAGRSPMRAQEASPAAGAGEWTFTDDREFTVTLPARPERIVAQVSAAAALWDYGVRPVGIFGPSLRADGSQDPQSGRVDLAAVTSVGQAYGEFDLEAFVELEPDLVVSQFYPTAPLWYLTEETEPLVEGIAPTVGIEVQDVGIDQVIARFADLAEALGADMESAANVAARVEYLAAEADLKEAIAAKPGLSVLVIAGADDTVYVANPRIVADLIYFTSLGLGVVEPDTEEFWDDLSWEQINVYPADLILSDARTQSLTIEQLDAIPTWRALPAVQAGQVAAWYSEPSYSYHGYAPVLRELAAVIRAADPDVT